MANDLSNEQYRKNAEEAKRFAALVLAGPCDTFELEQFDIANMLGNMYELTPLRELTAEKVEAEEGITKKWLFQMVEELHEMLERTIIANAAKTQPGELFYWIDNFAGTKGYEDWYESLGPEEE